MAEETQFIDAEGIQHNSNDKISFRMIVLEHLRKILRLSCVEFIGGYWQERNKVMGGHSFAEKYYVPDSREEYSNAVECLFDILYPHFDKEMREIGEELQETLEEVYESYWTYENEKKKSFNKQEYRADKRAINRRLFRALNCFLFRIGYLDKEVLEE